MFSVAFAAPQPMNLKASNSGFGVGHLRVRTKAAGQVYAPLARAFSLQAEHRVRFSSSLGFPSKTSAEIAPDHRKSSAADLGLTRGDNAQTRINIALCRYW